MKLWLQHIIEFLGGTYQNDRCLSLSLSLSLSLLLLLLLSLSLSLLLLLLLLLLWSSSSSSSSSLFLIIFRAIRTGLPRSREGGRTTAVIRTRRVGRKQVAVR